MLRRRRRPYQPLQLTAPVPLEVPPLRARPGDVLVLARHFAAAAGQANGRGGCLLDSQASELLAAQPWPGNVRQLENFVERLIVLYDGPKVLRGVDTTRTVSLCLPGATAISVA